jgi:hypothetical protein
MLRDRCTPTDQPKYLEAFASVSSTQGGGLISLESLLRLAAELDILGVVDGRVAIGGVPVEMTHTPSPEKTAHRKALPLAPARQEVHSETPEDGRLGKAL